MDYTDLVLLTNDSGAQNLPRLLVRPVRLLLYLFYLLIFVSISRSIQTVLSILSRDSISSPLELILVASHRHADHIFSRITLL